MLRTEKKPWVHCEWCQNNTSEFYDPKLWELEAVVLDVRHERFRISDFCIKMIPFDVYPCNICILHNIMGPVLLG